MKRYMSERKLHKTWPLIERKARLGSMMISRFVIKLKRKKMRRYHSLSGKCKPVSKGARLSQASPKTMKTWGLILLILSELVIQQPRPR